MPLFPLRERKLHSWVLLFELQPSTASFLSPLQAPLGKHSHGTPLAVVDLCLHSPQPPWLLWSSGCCSCHGNCYTTNCCKTINCHTLTWNLFAFWSPAVPTELSAVCLPLILITTVFLMYDEGKVGVNCQLRAERTSSLGQLMDKSKQCYVPNLEYYTWEETLSLKIVLQFCANCK